MGMENLVSSRLQYEPYLSHAGTGEDGGSEGDGTGSAEDDEGSESLVIMNGWLPSIARYAYKFH